MTSTVLFCSDILWGERGDEITAIDPHVEVVQLVGSDRVAATDLDRVTAAFFSPDLYPERSASFMGSCMRAPGLEWLHTFSAGTDHPIFAALGERGIQVTNSSGASAPSIAQTVMLYLLALAGDLPRVVRAQLGHDWQPGPSRDLAGMRLGIVGLGAIGSEVARLASAFGMEAIGLRRTVRGDEPCTTWPTDRLHELLRWADAIVIAAPLTDTTRGLIDTTALSAMQHGAWFVNVGRGEIVDEGALAVAVESGQVGGAALDVFATEPLPADSPLWDLPNVIVTPHSAGWTDRSHRRAVDVFIDNFTRRHRTGELMNSTD